MNKLVVLRYMKLTAFPSLHSVPQGGYALGTVVEACIQHQASGGSPHTDPIHVTAHFLRATNIGPGDVHIKLIKSGKMFTNLQAELVQKNTVKITAHIIFGDISPQPAAAIQRTLVSPSPYARRLPLHCHPSEATLSEIRPAFTFRSQMHWSVDEAIVARNQPDNPTRTTSETVGGGGVEWGAWCELSNEGDKLRTSAIPFFGDNFMNLPMLLPESEPGHIGSSRSWFPTIIMTIEFKSRIPSSADFSDRTVGIYFESRFLHDPQARHNGRIEVWTAPSCIGQGIVEEGWRDKQYCIAVADQMALMLPIELNLKEGMRDRSKL
ncbi:thioesterase-like superfamily-domain-containing protein [Scleroderma citrinum]